MARCTPGSIRGLLPSLICAAALLMPAPCRAHDIPDGLVDRSIQVVVFPDRIDVHYRLGMSDRTIATVLLELDPGGPVPAKPSEAVEQLRDVVGPMIPGRLSVAVDSAALVLEPVGADLVERHHVRLELVYRAALEPAMEPRKIEVHDRNFLGRPGYHRMAIKGREGARVYAATVPPILVRVPLKLWESLNEDERSRANQCAAQFATPSIPSKTHTAGSGR